MAWLVTISLQPTMGVAWHRFLAFFNIYLKRHADGRTSLGALQPIAQSVLLESFPPEKRGSAMASGRSMAIITWVSPVPRSTVWRVSSLRSTTRAGSHPQVPTRRSSPPMSIPGHSKLRAQHQLAMSAIE